MRHAFASSTLALVALLNGAPSWAGAAAGSFAVGITLNNPSSPSSSSNPSVAQPAAGQDVCFSRSLSGLTRARVEVTCSTGRFVSIDAVPGLPFLGVHGGAFRYVVPFVAEATAWQAGDAGAVQGTVTMLRVYDLTRPEGPGNAWWDRPLEMRVSF
jgi:hypothetical protein